MKPWSYAVPVEGDLVWAQDFHYCGVAQVLAVRLNGVSTQHGYFLFNKCRVISLPPLKGAR